MNYRFNIKSGVLKKLLIINRKNDKQNIVIKVCGRSTKYVFLKISQNSLENYCAEVSFLINLQALFAGLQPATLFNKRLQHR